MASETKAPTTRRKTAPATTKAAAKTAKPAKVEKVAKASPATTKVTVKKSAAKSAAAAPSAKKSPAKKTKPALALAPITTEARLRHIETAAYFIAEQRGFSGGDPAEDWLAAERQIDHLLLSGQL